VNQGSLYIPREYKRGHPKKNPCDRVQLCAQAICLEEMLFPEGNQKIESGEIFYGKKRRLTKVVFDQKLRKITEEYALEFHKMMISCQTPTPEFGPKCKDCSLKTICLAEHHDLFANVNLYLDNRWKEVLVDL
jgi:CRISPR-associated exonuclease Cas4